MSFGLTQTLTSTAVDGVVLRGTMMTGAGFAMLIMADLARERTRDGKSLPIWWLIPSALGQMLVFVSLINICFRLLPQFPITTVAVFDVVVSVVHAVLALIIGLGAASVVQQMGINLRRKFAGLPTNSIDWPFAAAIKKCLKRQPN